MGLGNGEAPDGCASNLEGSEDSSGREESGNATTQPADQLLALPALPARYLTFDEWKEVGGRLVRLDERVQWAIGDWWCTGEHAYGARAQAWAEGEFGSIKLETIRNYGYVARKVESPLRNDVLSYHHHVAVAPLPPEDQALMLDRAERDRLSVRDLRTVVARHKLGERHAAIAGAAKASSIVGQFALLYADPPWQFETYSDLGKELSPEQHYPTMSDEELRSLVIDDRPIQDVGERDAGCFMWCTSSNQKRAIGVLEAWGFEYKTNAVWIKESSGLGYIFLNQHELLLYGKRPKCKFPAPVIRPSSVFVYPRPRDADGKIIHSAKPPEIRQELERMYPHFTAANRIELFARGDVPRWTTWGNQA